MADLLPSDDSLTAAAGNPAARADDYVVVARRYRPQTFEEVIGQEHVTRPLEAAITSGRVGHAFLFTGARGTGKTSTARILAKALNCIHGPTPRPCNECDICTSISSGDDVDALEIDGASNRRIEEIRQLRQNVNIRPSRARFKIYIIDEVHMLTKEAFNALLKTLEEPPEHVKFIFCTTEPDAIPITILSRCQRFDFAGVDLASITKRLAQICEAEGVDAEPDALLHLARRAAGSMRDSQSLLEQLLAFGNRKITLAEVHEMLGTAGAARLSKIVGHLADRETAAALGALDAALREGVDVSQLLDELVGYFRDVMVTLAGCPAETLLYNAPAEQTGLMEIGGRLGLETILAMMQILHQAIARLRYSMHPRAIAELAIVRICTLADLEAIPALIAELRDDGAGRENETAGNSSGGESRTGPSSQAPIKKKWPEIASGNAANRSPNSAAVESRSIKPASASAQEGGRAAGPLPTSQGDLQGNLEAAWAAALASVGGLLADNARTAKVSFRTSSRTETAPSQVVATFPTQYNFGKQFCERNVAPLEQALCHSLGRDVRLVLATSEATPAVSPVRAESSSPTRQSLSEQRDHPWVKRAIELFDARVVWMDQPRSESDKQDDRSGSAATS